MLSTHSKEATKKALFLLCIFALVGLIGLAFSKITSKSLCMVYGIFGLPCPSCGLTRAFKSLFSLNFKLAFFYHPLFFVVPFVPLLAFVEEKSKKAFNRIIIFLIIIFLLVWIIRLVLFFPHTEPMVYNNNSIIARLFNFKI